MQMYKRPEMELDPAKKPGQIINRPPESIFVAVHGDTPTTSAPCCHKTFIAGYRCEGCPYGA